MQLLVRCYPLSNRVVESSLSTHFELRYSHRLEEYSDYPKDQLLMRIDLVGVRRSRTHARRGVKSAMKCDAEDLTLLIG